MKKGCVFRTMVAGIIFIAGYCTNTFLTKPEELQQKLENKTKENPSQYTMLMERAFEFSYGNWAKANELNGTDTRNIDGIQARILTKENTAYLVIEDKECNQYSIRRIDSDIAEQLGTELALGTPEQSIDQFIGTVAENPNLMDNYPKEKMQILRDYTSAELGKAAGELYTKAKGKAGDLVKDLIGKIKE